MNDESLLHPLFQHHAQRGRVVWIGLRRERLADLDSVSSAIALPESGLDGDRYSGRPGGRRQVTLIQGEHLDAAGSIMGQSTIDPNLTRRNIVVRGINLGALKDRRFEIGEAILEYSGECHPCSRMEENLGFGGYNAMRGHGGITARVLVAGKISVGDSVRMISIAEQHKINDGAED